MDIETIYEKLNNIEENLFVENIKDKSLSSFLQQKYKYAYFESENNVIITNIKTLRSLSIIKLNLKFNQLHKIKNEAR